LLNPTARFPSLTLREVEDRMERFFKSEKAGVKFDIGACIDDMNIVNLTETGY
jgi:hypothetical protein